MGLFDLEGRALGLRAERALLLWSRAGRSAGVFYRLAWFDCTGDHVSALLLGQIVYWFTPDRQGVAKTTIERDGMRWLAKRRSDWHAEIRVNPKAYDRAISAMAADGLVMVRNFHFNGVPTPHIAVMWDRLAERLAESDVSFRAAAGLWETESPLGQKGKVHLDKRSIRCGQKGEIDKEEITQRLLTETTAPSPTPCPEAGRVENQNGQKLPGEAKGERATAPATANATAWGGEAVQAGPERGAGRSARPARAVRGGRGAVEGAVGLPEAQDAPDSMPASQDSMPASPDSREAMLREAGAAVLVACGIAPSPRKCGMRLVVEEALALRCAQTRVADEPGSVAEAVELAVRRWGEYGGLSGVGLLRETVGVRRFFKDGLWLNPAVWPVDRAEEGRRRRM